MIGYAGAGESEKVAAPAGRDRFTGAEWPRPGPGPKYECALPGPSGRAQREAAISGDNGQNGEVRGAPVADALVLCFAPGMSLADWRRLGLLEREWALYAHLRDHGAYRQIAFVTYGGPAEAAIALTLDPALVLVCNAEGLAREEFEARIPELTAGAIEGAKSAVVTTNHMEAGPAAVAIAGALRAGGVRVGLVGRGGFLWSRFVAADDGAESARARRAGEIEAHLCREADLVVGTTPEMVDDLAWRYGVERARAAVVPNYVIGDAPQGMEDREGDTVLYAGQLVDRKRVDLLIRAMSRLPDEVKSRARLLIVGDGPEEARLRALSEELKVRATFEARLPHRELLRRMSRCALYAQASRLEGHPRTVIEAMAAGAPVVVADGPGLVDVVDHGLTGMCVPGHEAALAGAIEGLLSDKEWREALGAAAANRARTRWGLARVAGLEVAAHARALERGARRRQ